MGLKNLVYLKLVPAQGNSLVVTSLFVVGQLYCYLNPDSAIQRKWRYVVVLKVDWHTKDGSSNDPLQVYLYGMCV